MIFFFFIPLFEIAGIYSPNAYRGFAREFIKDLERIRFFSSWVCFISGWHFCCSLLIQLSILSLTFCMESYWGRPRAILDIIQSGEDFRISTSTKMPEQGTCERCGYISSQVSIASTSICNKPEDFKELLSYSALYMQHWPVHSMTMCLTRTQYHTINARVNYRNCPVLAFGIIFRICGTKRSTIFLPYENISATGFALVIFFCEPVLLFEISGELYL